MPQREQDEILGRLTREKDEITRRVSCRTSQAYRIERIMEALKQPWGGLDFEYIRRHSEPVKDACMGEFIDSLEKDLRLANDLQEDIDGIREPRS